MKIIFGITFILAVTLSAITIKEPEHITTEKADFTLTLSGRTLNEFKKQSNLTTKVRKHKIFKNKHIEGRICHLENCFVSKVYLRGDVPTHWAAPKKSYRIKLPKNKFIFGQQILEFILPEDRYFEIEILASNLANFLKLPHFNTKLVTLRINNDPPTLYLLKEMKDSSFLDRNTLHISHIIEINDVWIPALTNINMSSFSYGFVENNHRFNQWRFLPALYKTWPKSGSVIVNTRFRNMLKIFRNDQQLSSIEYYLDLDRFSYFYSLLFVFGNIHASLGDNLKFAFDPSSYRFSPFLNDVLLKPSQSFDKLFFTLAKGDWFFRRLISTPIFQKKFLSSLRTLTSMPIEDMHSKLLKIHEKDLLPLNQKSSGPRWNYIKRKMYIQRNISNIIGFLNSESSLSQLLPATQ